MEKLILIVLAYVLLLTNEVNAFQCYRCGMDTQNKCSQKEENPDFKKDCSNSSKFCITIYKQTDNIVLERGCVEGEENSCFNIDNETQCMKTCPTDSCNYGSSADRVMVPRSPVLLLLFSILTILLTLF